MRGLVIPSLLVVSWEAGGLAGWLSPDSASRPSEIVRAWVQALADGSLLRDTGLTLETALLGFAVAGALGLLLGAARGLAPRVRAILAVALIPLALMMLGFGFGVEASVVAFVALWPVLLIARTAVGLRVALGLSLLAAVIVEIVLEPRGLGHSMASAQQALRPDLMFAQLFWLGFVACAAHHGLLFAERRLSRSVRELGSDPN